MATNLALDDKLIDEARDLGGHKTKKEAVTAALQEYIQHQKRLKIFELFGTIDYAPDYDYKAARYRKSNGRGGHSGVVVGPGKKRPSTAATRAAVRRRVR